MSVSMEWKISYCLDDNATQSHLESCDPMELLMVTSAGTHREFQGI